VPRSFEMRYVRICAPPGELSEVWLEADPLEGRCARREELNRRSRMQTRLLT